MRCQKNSSSVSSNAAFYVLMSQRRPDEKIPTSNTFQNSKRASQGNEEQEHDVRKNENIEYNNRFTLIRK